MQQIKPDSVRQKRPFGQVSFTDYEIHFHNIPAGKDYVKEYSSQKNNILRQNEQLPEAEVREWSAL